MTRQKKPRHPMLIMIKRERKKRRMTQESIAEKVGVSHQTYAQFEIGRRNLGYRSLINIFEELEINVTPKQEEDE